MNSPLQATSVSSAFRLECRVRCTIAASAAEVWALLTDAPGFPRWNSTVTTLDGVIAKGNKLTIRVPVSERAFTPTVTELEPEARMVWRDGMAPMFTGERTFTLAPAGDGAVEFEMREVFSGLMLPMIKRTLPDFAPIFERYAQDLKAAAEGARGRAS